MNKFDRAVNKKASELITKNMLGQEVTEEDIKKFTIIARAIIREEQRGLKPNNDERSLYNKTWQTAKKYGDIEK